MKPGLTHVTRRLNLADPREIEAYESAFYSAFARATHNRLVRRLWDWDDVAHRLRTQIPYEDQAIWVTSSTPGVVDSGIGVNVRLGRLQATAFGFRVPAAVETGAGERRYCEVLTFFAVRREPLGVRLALRSEVFKGLRTLGFTHALATTAAKVLPLYRFASARVLADTWVEGEQRLFLEFDLSVTSRGAAPRGREGPELLDRPGQRASRA